MSETAHEDPEMSRVVEDLDRVIAGLTHQAMNDDQLGTRHALDHAKSAREWLRRRNGG